MLEGGFLLTCQKSLDEQTQSIRSMVEECLKSSSTDSYCGIFYDPQTGQIEKFQSPRPRTPEDMRPQVILCQTDPGFRELFNGYDVDEKIKTIELEIITAKIIKQYADSSEHRKVCPQ